MSNLAIETLERLTSSAKAYSEISQQSLIRNNHMNAIVDFEQVQQRHIDAVLVDFINYIANNMGIDYALYTKDLND